jgi:cytochrome c oxidase cbb3-type subunit 2
MSLFLKHKKIETNLVLMAVLTLITVSIGGLVQIVPLFTIETTIERVEGVRPFTPLELAGRNIYVREGCYTCHSQQIRPFRDEIERYGHYSLAAESMYDKPFQWGSKRTGPDLARVGGKYSDAWHVAHLIDPRAVVPESIMPTYAFLAGKPLGVPYSDDMIANAATDMVAQRTVDGDAAGLQARYPKVPLVAGDGPVPTEMDALVAYLQMLGTLVNFSAVTPQQLKQ